MNTYETRDRLLRESVPLVGYTIIGKLKEGKDAFRRNRSVH